MATATSPAATSSAASVFAAADAARRSYTAAGATHAPSRIDKTAEDFEAVFLTQMMERMFAGLGGDGPLGSGEAGGAYRSMLADQYGKTIAAAGGIGVAEDVRCELIALQQEKSS